jgi:hypothetical protein
VALGFLVCRPIALQAQPPSPANADALQPFQFTWPARQAEPVAPSPAREKLAMDEDCSLLHKEITAQFQFGFPAGIRVQFPFAGRAGHYTVAEVFAGAEWTVGVAMVGVRTIFEIPLSNPHHAFLVGPGVHAVYFREGESSDPRQGGGGLVDITFSWVFDRQARCSCECGLNLGLAVLATDDSTFPVPTFGIYGGFHF